jgi:hypothetical protein
MTTQDKSFSWGELQVEHIASPSATEVQSVSNGRALSILFNKADFNLSGEESPQTLTWIASLSIPVHLGEQCKDIFYHEVLRGFVQKDADARVLLMFDLGGEVHFRDHQYGREIQKDLVLESVYRIQKQTTPYKITLLVMIERKTPESTVLVAIDSIDIEASSTQPSIKGYQSRNRQETQS